MALGRRFHGTLRPTLTIRWKLYGLMLVSDGRRLGERHDNIPDLVVLDGVANTDPEGGEGGAGAVKCCAAVEQLGASSGREHVCVEKRRLFEWSGE